MRATRAFAVLAICAHAPARAGSRFSAGAGHPMSPRDSSTLDRAELRLLPVDEALPAGGAEASSGIPSNIPADGQLLGPDEASWHANSDVHVMISLRAAGCAHVMWAKKAILRLCGLPGDSESVRVQAYVQTFVYTHAHRTLCREAQPSRGVRAVCVQACRCTCV